MIEALFFNNTCNLSYQYQNIYNYFSETAYVRKVSDYSNEYLSEEEIKIQNLINEIKEISKYEVEAYDFEKIDDEMIALGIKFKDFPEKQNKVAYSIELMNKLDEKLPDNIDIFVV